MPFLQILKFQVINFTSGRFCIIIANIALFHKYLHNIIQKINSENEPKCGNILFF